ncbi:MAG TPA: hypothetical protein VHB53_05125 [Solirubrobacterales bacterium]|nr:hypothetical protein [Solirubrobacterales bacterium]
MGAPEKLASYQRCREQIDEAWGEFQGRRRARLEQRERFGRVAERVTENILEDLFTTVLDWPLADVNLQVGYADMLLTRLGVKQLIVEAKRPGALAGNPHAAEQALRQACGYAREQKVHNVAVSDGHIIYAAEVIDAGEDCGEGLHPRCFAALDREESSGSADELFWISRHGIYRPAQERTEAAALPEEWGSAFGDAGVLTVSDELLHPKYRLPARCFAYVGDPDEPKTWHLPFLHADGSVDGRRLPKAVQSILTNYRGATLTSVPEAEIPNVLVALACAATSAGKMPSPGKSTAPAYTQLAEALQQMDRMSDVTALPTDRRAPT